MSTLVQPMDQVSTRGRHTHPICYAYHRPSADCDRVKDRANKRGKVAEITKKVRLKELIDD